MNVFLIGMPGSGKSTLGRRLAELLELPFQDLDELIVMYCEKDIPSIFRDHGESYFRQTEAELLRSLEGNSSVISTGGGTPCYHGNMEWMDRNGVTVFLDVPDELLVERLSKIGKGERPLVDEHGDIPSYIERLKNERLPFYRQAQHIFTFAGSDPAEEVYRMIKS